MNLCMCRPGYVCACCGTNTIAKAINNAIVAVINLNKSRELYRLYLETYARTEIHTLSPISCNKDSDIATLLCQIVGQKDKWSRLPPSKLGGTTRLLE